MSSTLSEGVRVPDIGSVNWGADVNFNWGLLNTALANISGNVKVNVANTWTATQTFSETISGSIDGVAARAVNDEDGNNIKTALAGKAADNAVVHLAGAETITGDKTFTGSVATHNITPETDNTYSLGSSTLAWSAVYANTYYYGGTEFQNKFVTLDTAQTITGAKTFSEWVNGAGFQQTKASISTDVAPSSTQYFGYNYASNNDGKILLHHRAFISANTLNNTLRYWVQPNTATLDNYGGFQIVAYGDGSTVATFRPRGNLEPYDNTYGANLGSSSNKWKRLNGINPGALSLPAVATTWLDTTGWVLDGTTENSLPISGSTVTFGYGWLQFRVSHTLGVTSFVRVDTSYRMWTAQDENCLPVYTLWMPVFVDASFRVFIKADSVQVRFHPSLGNV